MDGAAAGNDQQHYRYHSFKIHETRIPPNVELTDDEERATDAAI
jgi:hypothetical protein